MRAQPSLIQSREHPLVKALMRVATSARERRVTQSTILDGERLIAAFRDSGGTAEIIAITQPAYDDPRTRSVFESTPARKHLLLAESLVRRVSQVVTTTGVLALVRTPDAVSLPTRLGTAVLLDGIQDPGNLGSLLRSAVAAGIDQVFLTRGSAFAWAPKVVRAGMGAHFFLAIHEGVLPADIARRAAGPIVATAPRAKHSLYDLDLVGPVLWVFGNEGGGLSGESAAIATQRISIPMSGAVESLNVAAAAAVCLFEQLRQRSRGKQDARP